MISADFGVWRLTVSILAGALLAVAAAKGCCLYAWRIIHVWRKCLLKLVRCWYVVQGITPTGMHAGPTARDHANRRQKCKPPGVRNPTTTAICTDSSATHAARNQNDPHEKDPQLTSHYAHVNKPTQTPRGRMPNLPGHLLSGL